MAIYALGDQVPTIDSSAYIHPEAVIIGDVTVGPDSSVWPTAVLRGDDGKITIGAGTSIQDGAVIHTTPFNFTVVGDRCTIGHLAHLEGCTISDGALVGTGSIVLHRAHVGEAALVAAGAVVLNDMQVEAGALAVGVPAKVKPGLANAEMISMGVDSYIERAKRFQSDLRRID